VKSVGVLRANPNANQLLCELVHVGNEADMKTIIEKGADAIGEGIAHLLGIVPTPSLSPEEAAAWTEMRALGVYSAFTKPDDVLDAKKLAVFMARLRRA
jgi:hypothetical protein